MTPNWSRKQKLLDVVGLLLKRRTASHRQRPLPKSPDHQVAIHLLLGQPDDLPHVIPSTRPMIKPQDPVQGIGVGKNGRGKSQTFKLRANRGHNTQFS